MELRKNGEARRADSRSDGSMERRKALCAEIRGGCIAADKRIHESTDLRNVHRADPRSDGSMERRNAHRAEIRNQGFTELWSHGGTE